MDWIKSLTDAPLDELQQTELVLPRQSNHYGTLYAPEALAMLGKTAYLAAARYCEQSVVMASAKNVEFLAPAPVGALVRLHAKVRALRHCSMTVEVRALLDDASGAGATEVLQASFVMVAVDAQGRPAAATPRRRTHAASLDPSLQTSSDPGVSAAPAVR